MALSRKQSGMRAPKKQPPWVKALCAHASKAQRSRAAAASTLAFFAEHYEAFALAQQGGADEADKAGKRPKRHPIAAFLKKAAKLTPDAAQDFVDQTVHTLLQEVTPAEAAATVDVMAALHQGLATIGDAASAEEEA